MSDQPKPEVPTFATHAEEAEFWATHSTEDYQWYSRRRS